MSHPIPESYEKSYSSYWRHKPQTLTRNLNRQLYKQLASIESVFSSMLIKLPLLDVIIAGLIWLTSTFNPPRRGYTCILHHLRGIDFVRTFRVCTSHHTWSISPPHRRMATPVYLPHVDDYRGSLNAALPDFHLYQDLLQIPNARVTRE
jgi:hypothetical protein